MFFTITYLIVGFIAVGISFSNNDKIFKGRNNKFIKDEYGKSYIKISKKVAFIQGILFILSAIANYKNYRIFVMIIFFIIMILGCYSTILTFKKNY